MAAPDASDMSNKSQKLESKSPDVDLAAKSSGSILSSEGKNRGNEKSKSNHVSVEESQAPRLNLDDVINAIAVRPEAKDVLSPFQGVAKGTEEAPAFLQSPVVQADMKGNRGSTPAKTYRELPVIPLSEFKHPDFPAEYNTNLPKPARAFSSFIIINVFITLSLTIGFVISAFTYRGLSEIDSSSKAYLDQLPEWKSPLLAPDH